MANDEVKRLEEAIKKLEPDPRGISYYASNDWVSGYEAGFESAKDAAISALAHKEEAE